MAGTVKVWIGTVAVGCLAALGLVSLWESGIRTITVPPRSDEARVYAELGREAHRTATAVQRLRWADTIRAHAGDSLIVLGAGTVVPPSARVAVAEARGRLEDAGRVAVAVVPAGWQRPPDGGRYAPRGGSYGIDYLLPEAGPCEVAAYVPGGPSSARVLRTELDPDRLLGPCAWVARYGTPGDSVRAWLRAGGGWAAMSMEPSREDQPRREDDWPALNRLELACLDGDSQACIRALRTPRSSVILGTLGPLDDDPVLFDAGPGRYGSFFDGPGAHLLADIEREIGPERFARFWRADRPLPRALSDALGRPAGEWIAAWARARFDHPAPGTVAVSDLLLTVLTIGVLVGAALIAASRGARSPQLAASFRGRGESVTNPGRQTS